MTEQPRIVWETDPGHAFEVRRWMGAAKRGLVTKAGKSAAKDTGEHEATQGLNAAGRHPDPLGQRGRRRKGCSQTGVQGPPARTREHSERAQKGAGLEQ